MKNNRGIVIILMLIIVIGITAFSLWLMHMLSEQRKSTALDLARMQAYWVAEAGVHKTIYKIKHDSGYRNTFIILPVYPKDGKLDPDSVTGTIQIGTIQSESVQGNYDVQPWKVIKWNPDQINYTITSAYRIESTGKVGDEARTIVVLIRDSLFNGAAFGGGAFSSLGGNARTDSYDSTKGNYGLQPDGSNNIGHNGDVGSNGDVTVDGSAYIDGDVTAGPDEDDEYPDEEGAKKDLFYGTPSKLNTEIVLPDVVVPDELTKLPPGTVLNKKYIEDNPTISGDRRYDSINLSGAGTLTIQGPSRIYVTGDSVINGQIDITGNVTIFTDGGVDVQGQSLFSSGKNPSNLQLVSTSSAEIKFAGGAEFYGVIYAPNADVRIGGGGNDASSIYGSVTGATVNMSGHSAIHYDENTSNLSPSWTDEALIMPLDYREKLEDES